MYTTFHHPLPLLCLALIAGSSLHCSSASDSLESSSGGSCQEGMDCSGEFSVLQDTEVEIEEDAALPDSSEDDTESNKALDSSCVEGKTEWTAGTPFYAEGT